MYPYIKLSHLQDETFLTHCIYNNGVNNYYITDDWSPEMYDALAHAGFISVSIKDMLGNAFLLPEMQFSYAVLHWENIHISKRLKQFILKNIFHDNQYTLSINADISAVLDGIKKYHGAYSWMSDPYITVLKSMINSKQQYMITVISVELWHNKTLIGGEIGYLIGSTYTSLTGFFDRKNYNNFGKVQLLCLASLLKKSTIMFWNMGHPYMTYKFNMGAIEYQRRDFLNIWKKFRNEDMVMSLAGNVFQCDDLLKEII
ncbi:MAG: hypothetical protein HQK75_20230 [Candidatus Magnetomorum sp.]|nr:hypothetical protein [Candidatus Magnetomorum sp.]